MYGPIGTAHRNDDPMEPLPFNIHNSPSTIREALLAWYDGHQRALPWRAARGEAPDPYRVWLSEVMLQQTRVETVRGYYERWLERFPTLDTLAAAPLDEVLRAWEGLGYYSRARNLHRAVREVAVRYGGRVPDEPEAFRALPGVGRYTAGAVMSIAFGRSEPIVDGNVRRVFARLTDHPDPAEPELWSLAAALVPGDRPGDLNQALMELGATVCTPRAPRCDACPVRERCGAFAAGTQDSRPARKARRPVPREAVGVAVVQREGAWLLARRNAEGRLGGMWEFPGTLRRAGESAADAAVRGARDGLGIRAEPLAEIGVVEHQFTHVRVGYSAVRCATADEGRPDPAGSWDACVWARPDELHGFALPVAQRSIASLAAEPTLFDVVREPAG
jgi:A/G-specific adenine glycosylase